MDVIPFVTRAEHTVRAILSGTRTDPRVKLIWDFERDHGFKQAVHYYDGTVAWNDQVDRAIERTFSQLGDDYRATEVSDDVFTVVVENERA